MRKSCFLFILLWFFIFAFNGCVLIKGQKVSKGDKHKLTIRIDELPENTPDTSLLYLPGSFNGWNPEAREFIFSKENGVYSIQLTGQPGNIIEYKVTRGSWQKVEVDSEGNQIENRRYVFKEKNELIKIDIENWNDFVASENKQHTLTGRIEKIEDFYMPQLDRNRNIWIYLPPDYEDSKKRYPVLYMQDGQNVFDEATSYAGEWKVDESLETLYNVDKTEGVIVVAINNHPDYRANEYIPWLSDYLKTDGSKLIKAQGKDYAEFIAKTLKPHIDSVYRTLPERENTGIAGSSFGAVISLYTGLRYQNIFSRIGVYSPSLWASTGFENFLKKQGRRYEMRFFLYAGGMEANSSEWNKQYIEGIDELSQSLQNEGFKEKNIKIIIDPEASHNEKYWSKHFPEGYLWLFED